MAPSSAGKKEDSSKNNNKPNKKIMAIKSIWRSRFWLMMSLFIIKRYDIKVETHQAANEIFPHCKVVDSGQMHLYYPCVLSDLCVTLTKPSLPSISLF
jgi:hypothetical protein